MPYLEELQKKDKSAAFKLKLGETYYRSTLWFNKDCIIAIFWSEAALQRCS